MGRPRPGVRVLATAEAGVATRTGRLVDGEGETRQEPRTTSPAPAFTPADPSEVVAALRAAGAGAGHSGAEIGYRDTGGAVSTRVVEDLEEDGHVLVGSCRLREDERGFLPDGVLAVRSVSY